jgi:hypothetical protein
MAMFGEVERSFSASAVLNTRLLISPDLPSANAAFE